MSSLPVTASPGSTSFYPPIYPPIWPPIWHPLELHSGSGYQQNQAAPSDTPLPAAQVQNDSFISSQATAVGPTGQYALPRSVASAAVPAETPFQLPLLDQRIAQLQWSSQQVDMQS
jgi:hypothetical protein